MSRKLSIGIASVVLITVAVIAGFKLTQSSTGNKENDNAKLSQRSAPLTPSQKSAKRFALLLDDSVMWRERLSLVRTQFKDPLSDADVDWLFAVLDRVPTEKGARGWWVAMNEIANELLKKPELMERYSDEMARVIEGEGTPAIARDYALQHLAAWVAMAPKELVTEKKIEEITSQMLAAAKTYKADGSTIAGTALNTLVDVVRRQPKERAEELTRDLPPFLQNVLTGEGLETLAPKEKIVLQVSALQAASNLGLKDLRDTVRGMLEDENNSMSLRISSTAALGSIGSADDLGLLEKLSKQKTPLQFAAKRSLQRLNQSLSTTEQQ